MKFSRIILLLRFHKVTHGDEGIRTPDPLLARQVLSQLSYTPASSRFNSIIGTQHLAFRLFSRDSNRDVCFGQKTSFFVALDIKSSDGLEKTRTSDLTLIRRAL